MSFWSWLDGGISTPQAVTWRQRLALWFGRRLAVRHRHVQADRTCRISPEARICPRKGRIDIGAQTAIAPGVMVQGNVTIGQQCTVQAYTMLVGYGEAGDAQGTIRIGDGVRIAPMVMMIAADHVFADAHRPIREQGMAPAPITVGDDVWIAGRVNIVAGVMVGEGAVIGAGSVVTRDIPPYSVAVGAPAKVVKQRGGDTA